MPSFFFLLGLWANTINVRVRLPLPLHQITFPNITDKSNTVETAIMVLKQHNNLEDTRQGMEKTEVDHDPGHYSTIKVIYSKSQLDRSEHHQSSSFRVSGRLGR